jgi:F-type H+-transporting ATPase subunit a
LGLNFFAHFIPEGTPFVLFPLLLVIELVRFCVRALSLGVRLFANIVAGHTLLAILGGFLLNGFLLTIGGGAIILITVPFAFFVCFAALEVGVAFIQAYVFTVLSLGYIRDALLQQEDVRYNI